jgi:hypothetical protein
VKVKKIGTYIHTYAKSKNEKGQLHTNIGTFIHIENDGRRDRQKDINNDGQS